MSEKQFVAEFTPKGAYIGIKDTVSDELIMTLDSIDLLNRQQFTIQSLKAENEQLREDRKVANDFIVKKGLDIEYYKHWRGLQDE